MTDSRTVHVVDDDAAVLRSLSWYLGSRDIDVRTYDDPEAFLEAFEPTAPSCVVMDLKMPTMDGITLQRRLHDRGVKVPIIFLTGYPTVATCSTAMRAGAIDYLEKPYEEDVLLDRIQEALDAHAQQEEELHDIDDLRQSFEALTPRQRQVLDHVVEGKANKVIAIELGLSEKTIELHRSKMMKRMGATSLPDLVRRYERLRRAGLL